MVHPNVSYRAMLLLSAIALGCSASSQDKDAGGKSPGGGTGGDAMAGRSGADAAMLDGAVRDGATRDGSSLDGALGDASGMDASMPDIARTLRNPLKHDAADPWVFYFDGYYYLTVTRVDRIALSRARSIADLGSAEEVTIWTDTTSARCCNIWAPEIHRIGNRFYVYYTADDGAIQNHRMFVLESEGDDPMGPYSFKAQLATQDFFAIDGSVLKMPDDALYFLWSGVPPGEPQNLYIAAMSNAWTLSGAPVLLAAPTQAWEQHGGNVNEGPEALYYEDHIFVAFSASQCATADYSLGLLTYLGGDPLEASAWEKSSAPVFSRADARGVYGPGHNSFFASPDGTEIWNAYHAIHLSAGSCAGGRSLRVQKVDFAADGTPSFGIPVAPTTSLPLPSGDPGPEALVAGNYRLIAEGSALALSTEGCAASTSSSNVELASDAELACQQWQITPLAHEEGYSIALRQDDRALAVTGCSMDDHADVALAATATELCQTWLIDRLGAGRHRISAKHSAYPLELDSCSTSAGTDANTWREYRGDACQQWRIQPVP